MDCEILTVGTELVLGFTVDTNAAEMARALAEAGIRVRRRASVSDELADVRQALAAALERCGTVIVTGGLGPTPDDLTRQAAAELFGARLVHDPAVLADLEEKYRRRGIAQMPASNRRQADVPEGATVLPNPIGTAPGLWIDDGHGRLAILLPGVPKEMRGLMESEVIPRLRSRGRAEDGGPGTVIRSRTLRTAGIPESALADQVGDEKRLLPPGLSLAWLPSLAGVDLRLTAWNLGEEEARAALEQAAGALRAKLGAHLYGEDGDDLAAVVLRALEGQGAKLAVAESCTGGLLGARLTAVPGSSRVFVGGVTAYANEAKLGLLGVSFREAWFTPSFSKFAGEMCGGAQVHVTDRNSYRPFETALHVVKTIREMYPDKFQFHADYFDKVMGTASVRRALERGLEVADIMRDYEPGLKSFAGQRKPYLLYE